MSSTFFRRDLPLMIIIITAIPFLLYRFISDPFIDTIYQELGNWSSIISMISWGLSVFYLFQGEYASMKQTPTFMTRWNFGVLCVFSGTLLVVRLLTGSFTTELYQYFYVDFYAGQSRAFYGLMFLYLCSASYRMLRARSLESFALLASGLIYLMRSASIFNLYLPWSIPLGEWVMDYPNKAATIAANISMTFGSMLIAVRQMLGRERTAIEVA
jgi:hypothetical protein